MLTRPETLAAYLYLRQADPMPDPILDENGEIDVAADNAVLELWSSVNSRPTYDLDRLRRFIVMTEVLLIDIEQLEPNPDEPVSKQYMTLFYEAAKDVFDHDKTQLRTYFSWLYLVLFQRPEGPRWGEFVEIYGADEFISMARERFANLIGA